MLVWDPAEEPASSHSSAMQPELVSQSVMSLSHPFHFPLGLMIFMEKCEQMLSFVWHEDLAGQFGAAVVLRLKLPLLQQVPPGVNLVSRVGFYPRPEGGEEQNSFYGI